jgi:hypothetical protein
MGVSCVVEAKKREKVQLTNMHLGFQSGIAIVLLGNN